MLDENTRMEHFSEAYVRALASRWGVDVSRHATDKQSIDLQLTTVGNFEYKGRTGRYRGVPLMAQLKCTFKHQAIDGVLAYPLKIKNYDDLRDEGSHCPRILIVVCVPKAWSDRLVWSAEELRLLQCGYWNP